MTQVGVQFAKMMLAKERSAEAAIAASHALRKRAYSEIHVCLGENVDALNSFPGIGRTVITLDHNDYGFTLISPENQRKVVLRIYDDKLYLGSAPEGGTERSEEERLLTMIFNERPVESSCLCDEIYECFQFRWGDLGIALVSTNEAEWAQLTVNQIVSRAFGMAINGVVSPLFVELEED
jgi:hypothetical protein